MDELLLGYYRHDLATGEPHAGGSRALITDFYCKNNLILGRGEHQMSGDSTQSTGWERNLTYDAPQYIVLGGLPRGWLAAGQRADRALPGVHRAAL